MGSKTGRGKNKREHALPYIADKTLFRAVMFALKMISEGVGYGLANYRAAKYYGYETEEVAHYVGIYANARHKWKAIRGES